MSWSYPAELLDALAPVGLRPTPDTPPGFVREVLNDFYRHELVRLREARRAGRIPAAGYADRVVVLRRKYWPLTLPLPAWERLCSAGPGASGDP